MQEKILDNQAKHDAKTVSDVLYKFGLDVSEQRTVSKGDTILIVCEKIVFTHIEASEIFEKLEDAFSEALTTTLLRLSSIEEDLVLSGRILIKLELHKKI